MSVLDIIGIVFYAKCHHVKDVVEREWERGVPGFIGREWEGGVTDVIGREWEGGVTGVIGR